MQHLVPLVRLRVVAPPQLRKVEGHAHSVAGAGVGVGCAIVMLGTERNESADGELSGYVRSAMYGHTLGGAVALGYIENPQGVDAEYVKSGTYEIEIAGERYPATSSLRPLYDSQSERIKA